MKLSNIYVVEWSRNQDCFHIDTLERTLIKNLEVALNSEKYNGDWKIVHVCESREKATEAMHAIRETMDREPTNLLYQMIIA